MPYSKISELPESVKKYPKGAQKVFMSAFNSALKQYESEDKAFPIARAAMNKWLKSKGYKMSEGGEISMKEFIKINPFIFAEGGLAPVQFLRTGKFTHPVYGKFEITETDIDTIIENWGSNDKPIGVEHFEEFTDDPDKAKAFGWIKDPIKKKSDDGVELWGNVSWTEKGKEYVQNEEYKYTSAVYAQDGVSKETGENIGPVFKRATLTNRPWIEGMNPVALSEDFDLNKLIEHCLFIPKSGGNDGMIKSILSELEDQMDEELVRRATNDVLWALQDLISQKINDGESIDAVLKTYEEEIPKVKELIKKRIAGYKSGTIKMTDKNRKGEKTMSEFMIKLAEIVGLEDKENATEDQIVQSFVALNDKQKEVDAEIQRLTDELEEQRKQTAPKEDEKIVKEKELVALNDQIVTLTEKAKAGETAMQKLTEMERDRVVGDAVREGKLIPALKEWAEDLYMSDPDKLRKYIEGAPVVLDEEVRGTSAEAPEKSAEMRLSEKAHEIKVSKDIPFRDALEQARTENPDLAEEYEKEKSERK